MGARFIAEVGSSHNGSIIRAQEIVEAAAAAGFWGVKLQHFRIKQLFRQTALAETGDLWKNRLKREVPHEWHALLSRQAHSLGMAYGLSVFDQDDVDDLLPNVDFWKVSSYDILRLNLIRKLRWRPLIISTGMANMSECLYARTAALSVNQDVSFMHCVSSYPTPREQANLAAIDIMQKMLCVPIGWSDHTKDREVVRRAVWRWRAGIVELHVDLDDEKGMEGSAHSWPMSMAQDAIRELSKKEMPEYLPRKHAIDGDGAKLPQPCEKSELAWRADPEDGLRPMKVAQASERT